MVEEASPMRRALVTASWLVASTATFAADRPALSRDEASPVVAAAITRGDEALASFREQVFARLNKLLQEGGPTHAIQVCRVEAAEIAKQIAGTHHVRIGRTSHKLRNPTNAPPAWAASYVQAAAGKKGVDVKPAVIDLGDRVGLLRPITVMPACTRCHGAVEGIDSDVRAELARAYPGDQATQFAPGDLRGFMWAEVPKR
jgi:hypothetical protein